MRRVLLIVMASLGIESTARRGGSGILLAFADDVLYPTFLNITIYPLELVDTHALHPP
jgi:hypothetical protein